MNHEPTPGSTIGSLLTNLRDETTLLIRQEVSLAKAELGEKAGQLAKNSAALAVGGATVYAGLIILLIGLGQLAAQGLEAAGVPDDVARWLGMVLVGLVVGLIGWFMLAKARKAVSAANLRPTQTLSSLRENKVWAQNKMQQHSHESAA